MFLGVSLQPSCLYFDPEGGQLVQGFLDLSGALSTHCRHQREIRAGCGLCRWTAHAARRCQPWWGEVRGSRGLEVDSLWGSPRGLTLHDVCGDSPSCSVGRGRECSCPLSGAALSGSRKPQRTALNLVYVAQ